MKRRRLPAYGVSPRPRNRGGRGTPNALAPQSSPPKEATSGKRPRRFSNRDRKPQPWPRFGAGSPPASAGWATRGAAQTGRWPVRGSWHPLPLCPKKASRGYRRGCSRPPPSAAPRLLAPSLTRSCRWRFAPPTAPRGHPSSRGFRRSWPARRGGSSMRRASPASSGPPQGLRLQLALASQHGHTAPAEAPAESQWAANRPPTSPVGGAPLQGWGSPEIGPAPEP
mmetsp:Transcript_23051/g.49087  ORF Transcript_23051/g.49087 Transcript_23051/m.49087 type:complete len:225 (-) Transcript_23051:890-1564(-)